MVRVSVVSVVGSTGGHTRPRLVFARPACTPCWVTTPTTVPFRGEPWLEWRRIEPLPLVDVRCIQGKRTRKEVLCNAATRRWSAEGTRNWKNEHHIFTRGAT